MKHVLQDNPVYAANMSAIVRELGVMGYEQAHALQLQCVQDQLDEGCCEEQVLVTEHPPVFTLGRSGSFDGLLKSREDIASSGVEIVHTERGGDITYHGPGQLVVYPIVNLRKRNLSVSAYIHQLEEIMLLTAADSGVTAVRDERNRGIWVGDNKIGSVGIRIRHGISFHGLALNVNLSLEPFRWVRPCGLMGVGVSSLQQELARDISMETVRANMRKHIMYFFCEENGRR
jgi:lipoate-protein ligase B